MITKEDIYKVIPKKILKQIIKEYELDIYKGIHGIDHWSRVLINGLKIAENNNANKNIIIAFSFFHDVRRVRECGDPEHGLRGAKYIQTFKYKINLNKEELEKTMIACEGHSSIIHHEDIDIATCWDADRLDLYRVGVKPDSEFLNTEFAQDKNNICDATKRSWLVREDWVINLLNDLSF